MTESTKHKLIVPEFITSKITHMKLNVDNCLQWRKIVKINLTCRGKKSSMSTYPPSSKMDEWEREDAALFSQLLNIMETKIQDLVMHVDSEGDMKLF